MSRFADEDMGEIIFDAFPKSIEFSAELRCLFDRHRPGFPAQTDDGNCQAQEWVPEAGAGAPEDSFFGFLRGEDVGKIEGQDPEGQIADFAVVQVAQAGAVGVGVGVAEGEADSGFRAARSDFAIFFASKEAFFCQADRPG
jgi:hypothetical protein